MSPHSGFCRTIWRNAEFLKTHQFLVPNARTAYLTYLYVPINNVFILGTHRSLFIHAVSRVDVFLSLWQFVVLWTVPDVVFAVTRLHLNLPRTQNCAYVRFAAARLHLNLLRTPWWLWLSSHVALEPSTYTMMTVTVIPWTPLWLWLSSTRSVLRAWRVSNHSWHHPQL